MDAITDANALEKLIERVLHIERLVHDVVKDEFYRLDIGGITSEQALILYRMDGRRMSPTDMKQQGCYLGSNVSYNVSQLVEKGYLVKTRSNEDKRRVHLQATERGLEVARAVADLFARLGNEHENTRIRAALGSMHLLEKFLAAQIRHIY